MRGSRENVPVMNTTCISDFCDSLTRSSPVGKSVCACKRNQIPDFHGYGCIGEWCTTVNRFEMREQRSRESGRNSTRLAIPDSNTNCTGFGLCRSTLSRAPRLRSLKSTTTCKVLSVRTVPYGRRRIYTCAFRFAHPTVHIIRTMPSFMPRSDCILVDPVSPDYLDKVAATGANTSAFEEVADLNLCDTAII